MNNKQQHYSSPTADLLVVRFEENIMSPNWSKKANTPGEIEDEESGRTYGF